MKKIFALLSAGLMFVATSCEKNTPQEIQPANDNSFAVAERPAYIPEPLSAYVSGQLYNIWSLPYDANPGINHVVVNSMYVVKEQVNPGTPRFFPVLSSLPPLYFTNHIVWEKVYVMFTAASKPHQFLSSDEIAKALAAPNPSIVIYKTGEFFKLKATSKDQPAE
jgi:hypothetical protein